MRAWMRALLTYAVFGVITAFVPSLAVADTTSQLNSTPPHRVRNHHHLSSTASGRGHGSVMASRVAYRRLAGVSCVPFARAASGIDLKGNAVNWWDAAAGVYQRGSVPERGAVLNFRATGGMRLGHVAVVRSVVGDREVVIDQANWAARGRVSHGTLVIDVSARNDWSAVRVELAGSGSFGAIYPTYGFIYDRPDTGVMLASGPQVVHPLSQPATFSPDDVAQAPADAPQTIYIRGTGILPDDAPSRTLR
jgi:surface antigen